MIAAKKTPVNGLARCFFQNEMRAKNDYFLPLAGFLPPAADLPAAGFLAGAFLAIE
jgi:hypothetical protein